MKSNISLKDYLTELTLIVNDFSQTGEIISSEVMTDFRSEKIGFIRGKITFSNESVLFFKEYLDLRYFIDKKSYSFHYQDKNAELMFRYDNALHKPALEFNEHKHIGNKIIYADIPNIADILEEIVSNYLSQSL
ncbi:Uncharacterized protein dnl_57670 [Desulfonema limicola]|uniref:Uncharacterized protein n=1 Tax=Desulfonema limicola TaxID=45656 RepID=A0A975BE07_9BACT|nr:DUF6516 family protein [Desulfonema limicola]QTA83365.1 Uncharacterized protein dnl_57670 [Desulfonema limicola]